MYRAEGRGSVYRFPSNRISVTYASRERVYSYRWSEISIVTRFRGSVLGRRRTCLWLIPRRPPVATRPIQRTRIERERERVENCVEERESIVMLTESRWLAIDRAYRYGEHLGIANFSHSPPIAKSFLFSSIHEYKGIVSFWNLSLSLYSFFLYLLFLLLLSVSRY